MLILQIILYSLLIGVVFLTLFSFVISYFFCYQEIEEDIKDFLKRKSNGSDAMKLDFTKKDLYSKEVKSHYELHTELEVIDDESNFKRFAIIVKKGE